jgi:hypothetical protein
MKSTIKLTLLSLLVLTISACDPWYWEERTFRILQILQNNQTNTVYSKAMVSFGGTNQIGIFERDTFYINRSISPGDTAQILLEDVMASRFNTVDAVSIDISLSDSQQFQASFQRTFTRNQNLKNNNFIETVRF